MKKQELPFLKDSYQGIEVGDGLLSEITITGGNGKAIKSMVIAAQTVYKVLVSDYTSDHDIRNFIDSGKLSDGIFMPYEGYDYDALKDGGVMWHRSAYYEYHDGLREVHPLYSCMITIDTLKTIKAQRDKFYDEIDAMITSMSAEVSIKRYLKNIGIQSITKAMENHFEDIPMSKPCLLYTSDAADE